MVYDRPIYQLLKEQKNEVRISLDLVINLMQRGILFFVTLRFS